MVTKLVTDLNSALSAIQGGQTLVAQQDQSSLRQATFFERASIAFNRKVLHRDPAWLKENEVNVGKTLTKFITQSKKGLSTDDASRLTRTLRFAGLEHVARVIDDASINATPPLTELEAKQRQDKVWPALLRPFEDPPEDAQEIRERLTRYIKENHIGDTALVALNKQLAIVEASGDELTKAQGITKAVEDFHRHVLGYSVDLSRDLAEAGLVKGTYLGEGGNATVTAAKLNGKDKVIKEFLKNKTYPITFDTTNPRHPHDPKLSRSTELTSAFLRASESDVVIAPSHFIVREKIGRNIQEHLVEVRDKEFRAWAKDHLIKHDGEHGYALEIIGEVQDVAPGQEVQKLLLRGDVTEETGKKIAAGFLDAISVLGRRGFVHGDIKLQNAFFDSATGKLKLIDVGSLAKVSKNYDERPNTAFAFNRGFTPSYSVPEKLTAQVGFAQDLYSTGISLIEIALSVAQSNRSETKFTKFINSAQEIQRDIWTGAVSTEIGNEAILDLIDKTFPLTGSSIENAGVNALVIALSRGTDWDDLRDRSEYEKIITELKAAL